MYKSLFSLLIVFLLCNTHTFAQQTNHKLDSLLKVSEKYLKEDTTKVNMLIDISGIYEQLSVERSEYFANEAIKVAEKTKNTLFIGRAFRQKANVFQERSKYDESLELYNKALKIFEKDDNKRDIAATLLNIGSTYNFSQNYLKSQEYYEKALSIFETLGDQINIAKSLGNVALSAMDVSNYDKALTFINRALAIFERLGEKQSLAVNYQNKAIIYFQLSDYTKSIEYFQKSQRICEQLGNKKLLGSCLTNIGVIYMVLKDYNKKIEYDTKALKIFEEVGYDYGSMRVLTNIAGTYSELRNYPKALEYHRKSLEISEKVGDKHSIGMANHGIGEILVRDGKNYAEALKYARKAQKIGEETDDRDLIMYTKSLLGNIIGYAPDELLQQEKIDLKERFTLALSLLQGSLKISREIPLKDIENANLKDISRLYESQGNFTEAFKNFKAYIAINDSIAGDEIKQQITRKEVQYEFDKKEAELKFQNQLTAEQLEKQKLLTTQQQQAILLQTQKFIIINKEKDLQRLAYLKEKAEKQEKEQQLSLVEKDKQIQASKLVLLVKEKAIQVQTLAKKNVLIGFLFSSLAGLLLAALAFYLWQRQKTLKQEKNNSMNFTKQLLESTESERRRIASDLHDSISHELLTLKSVFQQDIGIVNSKIDSIINDVRSISRNLHPVMFDKIGLVPNIMQFVERLQNQSNFLVTTDIKYDNSLTSSDELQIYRIIQEALTNIIKYAQAHAAKITIAENAKEMQLEIRDNGRGFDVKQVLNSGNAFGLHNIIERSRAIGGEASIKSSDKGTIIKISIPKNKNNGA